MTIAAGFCYGKGCVLCSDSQFTYSADISYGRKIFPFSFQPSLPITIGFAVAGDVANAQKAIRRICERIEGVRQDPTLRDVNNAIESALETLFDRLREHPNFGTGENDPDFNLIISAWTKRDGLKLFSTCEDCCNPVEDYEFVGSGASMGRYLAQDLFGKAMPAEEIITLATHVLCETKANDIYCGGNSEFIVFNDNGVYGRVAQYSISNIERFSRTFQHGMHEIFFALKNTSSTEDQINERFRTVEALLMDVRRDLAPDRAARETLIRALGILNI